MKLKTIRTYLLEKLPLRIILLAIFPWESLKKFTSKTKTESDDLLVELTIAVMNQDPEEMKRISKELGKAITRDANALSEKLK